MVAVESGLGIGDWGLVLLCGSQKSKVKSQKSKVKSQKSKIL
jgi:hypothetical protein